MKNIVKKNMVVEPYSGFAQRYNMIIGILLIALSTSILFLILQIGIAFIADIFFIVGSCIGLYFTFKNRKKSQSHIETGLVVGFTGSVLSLLMISFFIWIIYYIPVFGFDFILLLQYIISFFWFYGILYVLAGIIIGYLFGNYYKKRENVGKESPLF